MASPIAVIECIAHELGVPSSLVRNIYRTLGEADVIARVARGRRSGPVATRDVVLILVGCLFMTNGLDGTLSSMVKNTRTATRWKREQGKFVKILSLLIDEPENPSLPIKNCREFGIRFIGGRAIGMVRVGEEMPFTGTMRDYLTMEPVFFGLMSKRTSEEETVTEPLRAVREMVEDVPLYQDVFVKSRVLKMLHRLLHPDNGESA